jgi:enoyl-CoA hydratase
MIRVEDHGSYAVLVLDDPARRNALSVESSAELVRAIDTMESSGNVRVLVVTGAPPAFCAGADLAQLEGSDETGLRSIYAGFQRIVRSPMLTVAAVNGAAVGAGMNLALACDVRLAAPDARFDTRFLALGLHPGGGHTWLLRRAVPYSTAAALLLAGEVKTGDEAERIGLAHRCVPSDELVPAAHELAARIASAPTELLARTKSTLARSFECADTYEAVLEEELHAQLWSVEQPYFKESVAALRRRISSRS